MVETVTTIVNEVTIIQSTLGDVEDLDVFDGTETASSATVSAPAQSYTVQVGAAGNAVRSAPGEALPRAETGPSASQRTIVGAINMNTTSINQNEEAIQLNTAAIDANSLRIGSLEGQYVLLNDAVRASTRRIKEVEGGLAAVSSMPDLYLEKGETMSVAAAIGGYDDNIGFGTAISVRANQNVTFGLVAAHSNGHSAGKLQARIGW